MDVGVAGVQLESYLVLARGSPAMVQALAADGQSASGGEAEAEGMHEAAAPATQLTRPSTADAHPRHQLLYYCDVHRYARNHLSTSQKGYNV
jgi:hypothetical protein